MRKEIHGLNQIVEISDHRFGYLEKIIYNFSQSITTCGLSLHKKIIFFKNIMCLQAQFLRNKQQIFLSLDE